MMFALITSKQYCSNRCAAKAYRDRKKGNYGQKFPLKGVYALSLGNRENEAPEGNNTYISNGSDEL